LQRGADHIVALLDSVELALAVDTAAIREGNGKLVTEKVREYVRLVKEARSSAS